MTILLATLRIGIAFILQAWRLRVRERRDLAKVIWLESDRGEFSNSSLFEWCDYVTLSIKSIYNYITLRMSKIKKHKK